MKPKSTFLNFFISLKESKKAKIFALLIIVLVFYSMSLYLILYLHDALRDLKQSQRLNISELENLSKEEILLIIKERQENSKQYGDICFMFLILSILLTAFFTSLATYILYTKFLYEKSLITAFLSLLPEDEKKVYQLLITRKEILQSDLSRLFGNKVKASRIIKKLEKEGIVERIPYGNTYIIRLKGKY